MKIGNLKTRININKFMSLTSQRVTKHVIPEEIISSGDYESAEKFLASKSISADELSESFYRLGNLFFSSAQKQAAELAWQKSSSLSDFAIEAPTRRIRVSHGQKKFYLQTIGSVFLLIVCFNIFIFALFPREQEPFQLTTLRPSSGELSFWDEWWNTGRQVRQSMRQRFGPESLWPMLERKFKNLFSTQKKELPNDFREKLKRWLEFSQRPQFRKGPTNYYALIGKGLFEAREFEDALSTLNDGLHYAESTEQVEQLYKDLGTVYYYKGYKLQPNGLALYDLNAVRNSVFSYEMALRFGEDPYLYGNLGWGYYLLGDYSSSIESSLSALKLNPELNYVRMNLGIAHLKNGNFEKAFTAYDSLEQRSLELDEYEGGIRDLLELQQEFPGLYPFSNFVLGQLYLQHGRHKKAQIALQKFVSQKFAESFWLDQASLLLKKLETE